MKKLRYASICAGFALSAAVALGGCAAAIETNDQIDEGVHAPKRAMDMAKGVDTDQNIKSINDALYMVKSDNDGKPPATIEEAKVAAKVPAQLWVDSATGKPLVYDPVTGTVHREGAAANSAPAAGSSIGIPGQGHGNVEGGGGY